VWSHIRFLIDCQVVWVFLQKAKWSWKKISEQNINHQQQAVPNLLPFFWRHISNLIQPSFSKQCRKNNDICIYIYRYVCIFEHICIISAICTAANWMEISQDQWPEGVRQKQKSSLLLVFDPRVSIYIYVYKFDKCVLGMCVLQSNLIWTVISWNIVLSLLTGWFHNITPNTVSNSGV